MNTVLSKLLTRAGDLADVEPLVSLFLGAALLAVFLHALLHQAQTATGTGQNSSLVWTLYRNLTRLLWAVMLVSLLVSAMSVTRS